VSQRHRRGAALKDKPQALHAARAGVHVRPAPCGAAGALTGEAWACTTAGTQPSTDPVLSPTGRSRFLMGPQADPVTMAWVVASSLLPATGVSTQ
jgi:hypothetical protein